ncbi:LysR family transcriptional regulator [Larsenimonas suaedae]|uniref:LysR family transcriptional regulator n=1 Tax=Larsenimonas suaedae TaxID=1851019 RepID=A0ABU1GT14_9GAMM|nr:LysR family transcriptional regulator [Larsenimonas suaedae]MCM2972562.1 LysR family transcriptional regulator [Larsenimonas suaedae]MDR5894642.1 LysR family transcriptional regulator [Larsenimonas suaedae]
MLSENGKCSSSLGKHPALVWDDVRVFLMIARQGTLSSAATAMGLGVATLTRRLDRLEAALGVALFLRQQSGYTLAPEGHALLKRAEAMEDAALSFDAFRDTNAPLSGVVRVATAENIAHECILPHLHAFYARYPNLRVELLTDVSSVSVHRHEADLAIRMVRPERGNVRFKRLATLGYGLYASAEYVARHSIDPHSVTVDALSSGAAEFIGWSAAFAHLPAAQWLERALEGRAPVLMTTSVATQITAARAHLGCVVAPHFLARDAGLVCVARELGIDQPIYLVIQSDLAQSPRTRVLADFLSECVAAHGDRLSGKAFS